MWTDSCASTCSARTVITFNLCQSKYFYASFYTVDNTTTEHFAGMSMTKRNFFVRYAPWLAGLLLVVVGIWYFTRPAPIKVSLTKVERGVVEASVSNTRAGTVKACRRAKLAPPIGGQIANLLVKKGQRVKAGQVLLELWNNDLQAQERVVQQQLNTARTQADQACMQADLAEKEAARAAQLKERGFISAEAVDQKTSVAKVNRAGCEVAHSQIDQSRSRLAGARASLQRMVLRAPFDGIVADVSGELGEYATPSPPGILTVPTIDLIDDQCLFVSAPIDEVDAAEIKVGQVARITLDALKGKAFAGKVRRVACMCWKWKSKRAPSKWKPCLPSQPVQKIYWSVTAPMSKLCTHHMTRCCAFLRPHCWKASAFCSIGQMVCWKIASSRLVWPTGNIPRLPPD